MEFLDVDEAVRRRMAAVRNADTKPERIVRGIAHRLGYRFRLHRRDIPGSPDLTFPRHRKVIFVHGCFWHQHGCDRAGRLPRVRSSYWQQKLLRNVARDKSTLDALKAAGWEALVLWECELRDKGTVADKLTSFLNMDDLTP